MKWKQSHHILLGAVLWLLLAGLLYLVHYGRRTWCGMDAPLMVVPILDLKLHNWVQLWRDAERTGFIQCLFFLSPAILMPLAWRIRSEAVGGINVLAESFAIVLLFHSIRTNDVSLMRFRDQGLPVEFGLAFWCALPWFLLRLRQALMVFVEWFSSGLLSPTNVCMDFSRLFPAVGAAWFLSHQAAWFPLGFDPLIVLLTAAHFHHAGFTLPLMAGLNAKASPGCWTRFSCVAILAGVPLVAAGITCTHFGVLSFVEPFGVTVLVLGALGVAVSQIRRGMERKHSGLVRAGFVISGVSLLSAMILAMGFGLRHVVPNWALTMPQMWMIHGTLNAFGFGLCGLLAWRGALKPVSTLKD
jgi:hypothetical protein